MPGVPLLNGGQLSFGGGADDGLTGARERTLLLFVMQRDQGINSCGVYTPREDPFLFQPLPRADWRH